MAINARDVPPLVGEDHRCDECDLSYADLGVADADRVIAEIPGRTRTAVRDVPEERLRDRPDADTWSVVEYVCHMRDVYMTYTIRLHRTRTEDSPALEPMFNELRARRFRYNDSDVSAVLDQLAASAAGFRDEIARVSSDQWDRVASRLPGELRTARWLVRQATHEGVHHIRDIRSVAERLRGD